MTIQDFTEHKAEVRRWLDAEQRGVTVKASEILTTDEDGKVIFTELYAEDQEIIKAISERYGETEQIYFFPNGRYLFIDDQGQPYKIRQEDRPLTDDERSDIDSMRYHIKVMRESLTTDQDKEIYKDLMTDYGKRIKDIYKRAEKEGHFRAIPLKRSKQIRIYISSYYTDKFRDLGYTVKEEEREKTVSRWDDSRLTYYSEIIKDCSYSFVMNFNAFISACHSGSIP